MYKHCHEAPPSLKLARPECPVELAEAVKVETPALGKRPMIVLWLDAEHYKYWKLHYNAGAGARSSRPSHTSCARR